LRRAVARDKAAHRAETCRRKGRINHSFCLHSGQIKHAARMRKGTPSVPPDRSSGGTYPADNGSDASTLFSSGARRRLRATRIRSASLPDPATSFANCCYFLPVSPKATRIHKWDQEFESAFLQQRVYLSSEPPGSTRKTRGFAALCACKGT
jgi:hypothetical protein